MRRTKGLSGRDALRLSHSGARWRIEKDENGDSLFKVYEAEEADSYKHVSGVDPQDIIDAFGRVEKVILDKEQMEARSIEYKKLIENDATTINKIGKCMLEYGYIILLMTEEEYEPEIGAMWDAIRAFFSLGYEDKLLCWSNQDTAGYVEAEDIFEQYDFVYQCGIATPEEENRGEWPVRPDLTAGIDGSRTLSERAQGNDPKYPWPPESKLPKFKTSAVQYYTFMSKLTKELVVAIAKGIGLPPDYVQKTMDPEPLAMGQWSNADIKFFHYYRPDFVDPTDQGEIHVDIGTLTCIPLSGDGPGPRRPRSPPGLQVFDKAMSKWVKVEESAPAYSLAAFPSDVFRVWTGGYLGGTVHRVIRPVTEEGSSRYSMPFIMRPTNDCKIETFVHASYKKKMKEQDIQAFSRYDPDYRVNAFNKVIPPKPGFSYVPDVLFRK